MGDKEWMNYANCKGVNPDLFFPDRGNATGQPAKQVCRGCVVADQCLNYALANHEKWGVWGGLTEKERRQLRRQLRAVA